jgi:hypothetical protein
LNSEVTKYKIDSTADIINFNFNGLSINITNPAKDSIYPLYRFLLKLKN